MSQHIMSLLFFAAAMQGFLLAGVLGLHKRNIQANHILAVWIALLSVDLLGQIYYAEGMFRQFPQFIGLTNFLLYGLFCRSYAQPTIAIAKLCGQIAICGRHYGKSSAMVL